MNKEFGLGDKGLSILFGWPKFISNKGSVNVVYGIKELETYSWKLKITFQFKCAKIFNLLRILIFHICLMFLFMRFLFSFFMHFDEYKLFGSLIEVIGPGINGIIFGPLFYK